MEQPGTSYRICVFRSSERYDDYHREYVEILPLNVNPRYAFEQRQMDQPITPIRLQRFRASLHISYEMLRDLGIDAFRTQVLNIQENQAQQALLLTVFRKVSELTYSRIREEERNAPEHTIILDKVEVIEQIETDRLLVDLVIYACQHRNVELCQRYFEEYFYRICDSIKTQNTNITDSTETGAISQIQRLGPEITQEDINRSYEWLGRLRFYQTNEPFFPRGNWTGSWKPEAEEKALKLLESMLSKEEFEIYKKDGYVMIEGKTHKMYKVRKNAMIAVSEKQKDGLYKDYRLCIEPKNYGTICPTDQVIAKIKLIQADENKLHEIAKRFEGR